MFITFEGPEGAGKSTAIGRIADRLRQDGHEVITTREPGAGEVGKRIREILLHGETLDPKTELFLFLADRAQHVATLIRPAIEAGKVVLCDRFADSTVVYQGVARGLSREVTVPLNVLATGDLTPDLTLLFDVSPEVGLARVTDKDRLDAEPLEFHTAVRNGFLAEAKKDPNRWVVIDAERHPETVVEAALIAIRHRMDLLTSS
jgi:dTMP kinase